MRKTQMVTDRELEIMKVLWVRERASVREVQEDLNRSAGPVAYSTVQTLLNIMEEKKGLVDMSSRAERSSTSRRSRPKGRSES